MKYKLTLLVALTIGFVTISFSQHQRYPISNGFGVMGGMTKFDIKTDNFVTQADNGFIGGLSAVVDIPHKWYNISFGMQLSESNIKIAAKQNPLSINSEFVKYKMFAAQVALLMHIKPIQDYFTIDIGPMFQYNGKLEMKDSDKENYVVDNYNNLLATDITDISQFNFNGLIGASLGVKNFKLRAQYIYGFTNILRKLNDQNIDTSGSDKGFKGNQSMIVLGAAFNF